MKWKRKETHNLNLTEEYLFAKSPNSSGRLFNSFIFFYKFYCCKSSSEINDGVFFFPKWKCIFINYLKWLNIWNTINMTCTCGAKAKQTQLFNESRNHADVSHHWHPQHNSTVSINTHLVAWKIAFTSWNWGWNSTKRQNKSTALADYDKFPFSLIWFWGFLLFFASIPINDRPGVTVIHISKCFNCWFYYVFRKGHYPHVTIKSLIGQGSMAVRTEQGCHTQIHSGPRLSSEVKSGAKSISIKKLTAFLCYILSLQSRYFRTQDKDGSVLYIRDEKIYCCYLTTLNCSCKLFVFVFTPKVRVAITVGLIIFPLNQSIYHFCFVIWFYVTA